MNPQEIVSSLYIARQFMYSVLISQQGSGNNSIQTFRSGITSRHSSRVLDIIDDH